MSRSAASQRVPRNAPRQKHCNVRSSHYSAGRSASLRLLNNRFKPVSKGTPMNTSTQTIFRSRHRRHFPARQAGATVVEFAVLVPLALLVVFGIIQLGLMYSAKSIVNEATFVAARAGALQNAQKDKMTDAVTQALIPFYQDTTNTNDFSRLS